ncbi:hypothetical protein D3C80_1759710 [compost metagenome]
MVQLIAALQHDFGQLRIFERLRQLLLDILHGGNIVCNQNILVDLSFIVEIRHDGHMQP